MTTKQYLGQIERLNKMIDNKLLEIRDIRDRIYSVSAQTDKERVQTSNSKDSIGEAVSRLVDLERETDKLVDSFVSKKQKIISQIDKLEKTEQYEILTYRYVQRRSFDDICGKMNMSRRKMFTIYGQALKEFERLYGETYI